MPGKQKIDLYCLCWNDARMLPYFFRHYDPIVDRYFVYDNGSTDGSIALLENHGRVQITHFDTPGDSFVEEECRLGDTMWQNSDADWVIITDIDEHIYHPRLLAHLQQCADEGITAIRSVGYEMVSDSFPNGDCPLYELVPTGVRSVGHDRLCIFNPKQLTGTNYAPGRHTAEPTGHVVWPAYREILLLHFKNLGLDYLVVRSAELLKGLKPKDIKRKWGIHYTWSEAKIAEKWQELSDHSGAVPGLGSLKHMDPADFVRDERIIAQSGLFDAEWYLLTYRDVAAAGVDPVEHYGAHGWQESRRPNYYFDPQWYCEHYPEVLAEGRNPLCDYVERGEKMDAWPSPLFHTGWYRTRYQLSADESPLRHYLTRRSSGTVSPVPDFDVEEYCRSHPGIVAAGADPFEEHVARPTKLPRKSQQLTKTSAVKRT
jgi:hypothetical protein